MKEITPDYYNKFSCIAEKCKHNCCIGWEIDIDEDTMKKYQTLDTPLGERIRQNTEGETPHFVLGQDERCPFLNACNRCDIITELGEEGLCDICHLHPRFINNYSDFSETGLGLCCEEAARIILSETERFHIELPKDACLDDEEKEFFKIRSEIFSVIQCREESIKKRLTRLSQMFGLDFCFDLTAVADFLLDLERLDEGWTDELLSLKEFDFDEGIFEDEKYSLAFENLACYFVFRHLYGGLDFGDYSERVRFVLVGCYVIGALWAMNNCDSVTELAEYARMYSSEIEYSEDNTYSFMDAEFF